MNRATINGKPIVSHMLPQEGRFRYIAMETCIGDKTIFTGCGAGKLVDGEVMLTPIAQNALSVIARASNGTMIVCECRNERTARDRTIRALESAKDKDAVFVVCKDSDVLFKVLLPKLVGLTSP